VLQDQEMPVVIVHVRNYIVKTMYHRNAKS
jgi:hypothetical protein